MRNSQHATRNMQLATSNSQLADYLDSAESPYGRNAKMTFCIFMSQERHKPFLGMFIFIMGVSPSNFVVLSFLLTSLRKGYFLRQ